MNEGLMAVAAMLDDKDQIDAPDDQVNDYDAYINCFNNFPSDIALAAHFSADPKMLDKALHRPNAKEWQEALDYKINQLEKLQTWVIEDLPPGQTVIPCSEVIKVK